MPRGLAVQLPCPDCHGTNTYVVCTKHTTDGDLIRRRVCRACNHRWYTQQKPEQLLSPYAIRWNHRGSRYVEVVEA